MRKLYTLREVPELTDPVMLLSMDGWIDAGMSSVQAIERIADVTDFVTVASFDVDLLINHRARRPTALLRDGLNHGLFWPSIELRMGVDNNGKQFLILVGPEPDHLWYNFAHSVVELALELGVTLVVGVGAYPAPVPHTRETGVVATGNDEDMIEEIGYLPQSLQVPAGINLAIEEVAGQAGLTAINLWAQIPQYTSGMAYPAGALALLRELTVVAGIEFDPGELTDEALDAAGRIDKFITGDPENEALVAQLERRTDLVRNPEFTISGDDLAAQLEEFLREEDEEDND